MNRICVVPVLACVLITGGCGVATPPQVSTIKPASLAASVGFDPVAPDGEVPTQLGTHFLGSLRTALTRRGIAADVASSNHLAVGFSVRPASIGLGPQSPPKGHRWYDACHAQRAEATVVLREVQSGSVIGRWRAAYDDCTIDTGGVEQLAEELAHTITGQ